MTLAIETVAAADDAIIRNLLLDSARVLLVHRRTVISISMHMPAFCNAGSLELRNLALPAHMLGHSCTFVGRPAATCTVHRPSYSRRLAAAIDSTIPMDGALIYGLTMAKYQIPRRQMMEYGMSVMK